MQNDVQIHFSSERDHSLYQILNRPMSSSQKKKKKREILRTLFYTKEIVQPAHQATKDLL